MYLFGEINGHWICSPGSQLLWTLARPLLLLFWGIPWSLSHMQILQKALIMTFSQKIKPQEPWIPSNDHKQTSGYLSPCCRRSCAISLHLWEKATSTPSPTAFLEENPFFSLCWQKVLSVFPWFYCSTSWDLYHSWFLYQLFSQWNQGAISWFLMLYSVSNRDCLYDKSIYSVRHAQGPNVWQLASKIYLPSACPPAY